MADKLAKLVKYSLLSTLWLEDIPSDVAHVVLSDRSFR